MEIIILLVISSLFGICLCYKKYDNIENDNINDSVNDNHITNKDDVVININKSPIYDNDDESILPQKDDDENTLPQKDDDDSYIEFDSTAPQLDFDSETKSEEWEQIND